MPRRLKVDLASVELAFEGSDADAISYLNLATGDIVFVGDEIRHGLGVVERLMEERSVDIPTAVAESDLPDWEKDAVLEAASAEADDGSTYIEVPRDETRDAYQDMDAFTETVSNPLVRQQLLSALSGSRPFRRFKDAVSLHPGEEQRWFAFRDERLRGRIMQWLASEDIELIDDT